MVTSRTLLLSIGLACALTLGACSSDEGTTTTTPATTAPKCTSGSGATICVTGTSDITLEGFLPGSTATLTVPKPNVAPTTTRFNGTTTAPASAESLPVVISGEGRATVVAETARSIGMAAKKDLNVRGVSATNRPVNLTIAVR